MAVEAAVQMAAEIRPAAMAVAVVFRKQLWM
jgi:hypothetical protein